MLPRIRTIKPEFFRHSGLYDLEVGSKLPARLAFAGIWTCCDREGRFDWDPRELKVLILPYDKLDFSRVLDALATRGFIVKYASHGREYGFIPSWKTHQFINNRESKSHIPEPPKGIVNQPLDESGTREARVDHASHTGTGKEGNGNYKTAEREKDFETFWKQYPRSEQKQKAKAVWMKGDFVLAEVLGALLVWKRSRLPEFMPYGERWLRGDVWRETPVGGGKELELQREIHAGTGPEVDHPLTELSPRFILQEKLRTEWEEKRKKGEIPVGLGVSEYRKKRLAEMQAAQ